MEEEGRKRRSLQTVAIFALATIIGINLLFTTVLWQAYEATREDYAYAKMMFNTLLRHVRAASQYVTVGNVTLKFQPFPEVQYVSGTTITYVLGFVTVSNLTNIIARPLTLTVLFVPNVTYPEWGRVTYEYTDFQVLEIPPGLDEVMMPWGAFPITLEGFTSGDIILWTMEITAIAKWVDLEVARVSLTVTFKLIVV